MLDNTGRWVFGGVFAIAAFVLTFMLRSQAAVDTTQDVDRASIQETAQYFRTEQRKVNYKLSEGSKVIAEALREVATTLKEVDNRGSLALREHERLRESEAH